MRLYFVRHGKAEPGSGAMIDHDRPLTADGAARLQTEAQVLARLGVAPDRIYSSPRVRARQTADILAGALQKQVEVREEVNFDFDLDAVVQLTEGLPDNAEVMFVGHNPSMEAVVRLLTGAEVLMKVGSLARVDVEPGAGPLRGRLIWLLAPRVFDALQG